MEELDNVSVCLSLLEILKFSVYHLYFHHFVYHLVVLMLIVYILCQIAVSVILDIVEILTNFVEQKEDVITLTVVIMPIVLKDLDVWIVFVQLAYKEIPILVVEM